MEKKRRIAYGVINWTQLVRECFVVDNTCYIRELESVQTPVFLRPKRFGKSVVCSMLAHYYDVNLRDRFEELFGKTDIGRNPTPLRNSFLVLQFDFSTIQVGTLAEIEDRFWNNVKGAVSYLTVKYKDLADWSAVKSAASPAECIDKVREVIRENRLPPLYVIIDEYDNFTNELVVSGRDMEYNAVCGHDAKGDATRESFLKAFFKSFKAGLADGTVGRTYFTGVLPITLDDLSSGYNVGTIVNLNPELLGLVGFTQAQVERYVDDIYAEYGFDRSNRADVLADLKAFYDGYRFLPGAEPLYNSTICNWYLFNLRSNGGKQPMLIIDSNVRTDIGWFRRLAQTPQNALAKVRQYVERGEGEDVVRTALSSKFGRAKFFSEEFFPYALYYLGLMTFEDEMTLNIPNLTIKNMFVDYYDELSEFTNVDEARRAFVRAAKALALKDGTWRALFDAYWLHYVKARIPAQAFDKMNDSSRSRSPALPGRRCSSSSSTSRTRWRRRGRFSGAPSRTRRRSSRRLPTARRSRAVPTGTTRSPLPSSRSAAAPATTGSICQRERHDNQGARRRRMTSCSGTARSARCRSGYRTTRRRRSST